MSNPLKIEIVYEMPDEELYGIFEIISPALSAVYGGSITNEYRVTKTLFEFLQKDCPSSPWPYLFTHFNKIKNTPLQIKYSVFGRGSTDLWFDKAGNIYTACFRDER